MQFIKASLFTAFTRMSVTNLRINHCITSFWPCVLIALSAKASLFQFDWSWQLSTVTIYMVHLGESVEKSTTKIGAVTKGWRDHVERQFISNDVRKISQDFSKERNTYGVRKITSRGVLEVKDISLCSTVHNIWKAKNWHFVMPSFRWFLWQWITNIKTQITTTAFFVRSLC